jgi:hypothetical protein
MIAAERRYIADDALQIAYINPHPILRLSPASAPLTPCPRFGRLDLDRHLTVGFSHVDHTHTTETKHRLGARSLLSPIAGISSSSQS